MNRIFLLGALLVLPFFSASAKKKSKVSFYLPPYVLCEVDTSKWVLPYQYPTLFEAITPKATVWNKGRTVEFKMMHLFAESTEFKEDYAIAQNKLSSGGKQDLLMMAIGDFSVYYYDSKSSVCAIYRTPDKTAIVVVANAMGEAKKSLLSELKKWVSTFRFTTPEDLDRSLNVNAETNWQSIFTSRSAHEKMYIKNLSAYFGNTLAGNKMSQVNEALKYHQAQKDFSFKKYFEQRARAEKLDLTKEQAKEIFDSNGDCASPIRMYVQVNKQAGIGHEEWMEKLRQKFDLSRRREEFTIVSPQNMDSDDGDIAPPPAVMDSDVPVSFAQEMPVFPGGEAALMNYISSNIRFPQSALDSGAQGAVYLSFVVNKRGEVKDVRVERNSTGNMDCATEAVRVVRSLPLWSPGKNNGQPVNVKMMFPVRFLQK